MTSDSTGDIATSTRVNAFLISISQPCEGDCDKSQRYENLSHLLRQFLLKATKQKLEANLLHAIIKNNHGQKKNNKNA